MFLTQKNIKGKQYFNRFSLSLLASMEVTFAVWLLVCVYKKEKEHLKSEDMLLKTLLTACMPQ